MLTFLEFNEGAVAPSMQGKQKPYVSSDGKGNYEVLGNTGQTKASFTRAEHGKDAHVKAQQHLKSKYNEYMKEEVELTEAEDKAQKLQAALARHSANAIAANKCGDDEACKAHQEKMNIIKDKMAKLARNEEVELGEEVNVPFDGPYTKAPSTVKDKSGAVHTPMSRARDLARTAMKKVAQANKEKKAKGE
jgi:hypothetical protein